MASRGFLPVLSFEPTNLAAELVAEFIDQLPRLHTGDAADWVRCAIRIPTAILPSAWNLGRKSSGETARVNQLAADKVGQLVDLAKDRLVSVWSTGFSGAKPELLSGDEYATDLEWAIANPWKSGLSDLGFPLPHVLAPCVARYPKRSIGHDYQLIGGVLEAEDLVLVRNAETSQPRSMRFRTVSDRPNFKVADQPTLLFFPIHNQADLARTLQVLVSPRLVRATTASFAWDDLPSLAADAQPKEAAVFPMHSSPELLACLFLANRLRESSTKTQERQRDILLLCAGQRLSTQDRDQKQPDPVPRSHIAAMQGLVTMTGLESNALFRSGRLEGFALASGTRLGQSGLGSLAWIMAGHKRSLLETQSAVSIETANGRGLRQTQRLRRPDQAELEIRTDYLYFDEGSWLFVDMEINLPRALTGVDELVPFCLQLPCSDSTSLATTSFQDSTDQPLAANQTANPVAAWLSLAKPEVWSSAPGTAWSIRSPEATIHIKQAIGTEVPLIPLDFRVVAGRRGPVLQVVPFGRLRGSGPEAFPAGTIRLSFALSPTAPEAGPPALPKFIERELNKPGIYLSPLP